MDREKVESSVKAAKERKLQLKEKKSGKNKDSDSRGSEGGTAKPGDSKEQQLPPPPGRPGAVPLGLTPRFRVGDLETQGAEEITSQLALYRTGVEGNGIGVLLIGDLWGWNSGRTRAVADFLAGMLNAFVVVPRLLDSPTMEGGTHGDGLSVDYDKEAKPAEFRGWLLKYAWDNLEAKVRGALIRLRNSGAKRIAGVGLGFGTWVMCHAAAMAGSEYICGVLLNPTLLSLHVLHTGLRDDTEQDRGRKLNKLIRAVPGPHLLCPTARELPYCTPGGDVFECFAKRDSGVDVLPGDDPPAMAESWPFPQMNENWLDRGDVTDPAVREAVVEAVHITERYLRKHLWPLERGRDAARLRLLAKEGGSEEKMADLLLFGVPAGGKDSADKNGLEPLHYAARAANTPEVNLLVKWQADINAPGGAGGETPLHLAAHKGQIKFLHTLLKLKARPEVKDKAGQNPLHHAARLGQTRMVKILLSGKAQIDPGDTAEQTPLHLAAWYGKSTAVQLLLDSKMNVEPLDLRVKCPAERAMEQGWDAVANLLNEEKGTRDENPSSAQAMLQAVPEF